MGFGMQRHQLDYIQTICTSLQTDNHTNTSSLNFFTGWMLFSSPANSVKALNAKSCVDTCLFYGYDSEELRSAHISQCRELTDCVPVYQVCVRTDDMDLAGDIVQELCDFLNISELASTADFPLEFNALQEVLTMVQPDISTATSVTCVCLLLCKYLSVEFHMHYELQSSELHLRVNYKGLMISP